MSDPKSEIELGTLSVATMERDGRELMEAHWVEIASDPTVPLDPDWDAYYALEKSGKLMSIGAWVGGKLAGYFVGFVLDPHPHYKSWSVVHNDIFYVKPEHRGGRVAASITRLAKVTAKGLGLDGIVWHCKPDTVMHSLMDRSPKHRLWEHTYVQEI